MDVLSDVLQTIRVKRAVVFDLAVCAPWVAGPCDPAPFGARGLPGADHVILLYVVTEGRCWAEEPQGSGPPLPLHCGDIALLPRAGRHVLCSTPGLRAGRPGGAERRADVPLWFNGCPDPGTGERTRFVCLCLGCEARPCKGLLHGLPRLLHIPADRDAGILHLVRLATAESQARRAGGETILVKLAEIVLFDALRRYIARQPADATGWLAGLQDVQISAALALLHDRPTENWTVEHLAHEVGLSRSIFADRFAQFMRDTPMHYLTRWRMHLAACELERQGVSIAQVAADVGYASEAAFNRAFKRCLGTPPGLWRRARSESGAADGAWPSH